MALILRIVLYLVMFTISMYCLSGVQFEKFMNVTQPNKVRIMALLMAMGLAYVTSEFLLGLMIFIG